jgi:thioredoxin reductase (NADPH)
MPKLYSTSPIDATAPLLVVGLCAEWCGTCREFEPLFAELAEQHPEARFVWLDIEDDSAMAGDIDVEHFPTLAVFRDAQPVYFGTSLPQRAVVARLINALASGAPRRIEVPPDVAALPAEVARLGAD